MAHLRRPPYTKPLPPESELFTRKGQRMARWKDAKGKTREAPLTEDGQRIRLLAKKWHGTYRNADGVEQTVALSANKTAAEQMLNELVRKAELGRAGITDPYEAHRRRALTEHLGDFAAHLKAKGGGEKHARNCVARVRRIVTGCGFAFMGDIQPSRVQQFLADLTTESRKIPPLDPGKELYTKRELAEALGVKPFSIGPLVKRWGLEATGNSRKRRFPRATAEALRERLDVGRGPATVNHYCRSIKTFTAWLVSDRRAGDDPLVGLSGLNPGTDVRHGRRPLSPAQLGAILETTLASTHQFRGLTGRDRHFLYLLAMASGFRASELASMTPESFALSDNPPTATVAAGYTKNKKTAVQPLSSEVAEALAGYLADRPAGPVWPGTWVDRAADMLRHDLEAAGIPYEVEGPDGPLFADFHALRHSYIALLDRAGLTLKQAMQLARHSDPKLTMARYGRAQLADLGTAVEGMPRLLPSGPASERQTLAATGTDGALGTESLRQACAPADGGCVPLRLLDGSGLEGGQQGEKSEPLEMQGVENRCDPVIAIEGSAPCRTRTYNPLIKSQQHSEPNSLPDNTSSREQAQLAPRLAPKPEKPTDPELARIIKAWPTLAAPLKAAVLALVKSAGKA